MTKELIRGLYVDEYADFKKCMKRIGKRPMSLGQFSRLHADNLNGVTTEHTEMLSELYAAYEEFMERRGEKPISLGEFSREMVERGYEKVRTGRGAEFKGIVLLP